VCVCVCVCVCARVRVLVNFLITLFTFLRKKEVLLSTATSTFKADIKLENY